MNQQLLSPTWYRVAGLRPRVRSHIRVHRHEYRGERWYVIEDRISRRTHRFNPAAHFIIGLMNGHRTVQEIWDGALRRFGDEVPTQDEVIQLLSRLHLAEVIQCDVTPDVDELLRRSQRFSRRTFLARLLSPLAIKFPLLDPDRFLEQWLPWYRALFGVGGAFLWLVVVGWGVIAAAQHWGELAHEVSSRVLAPENLVMLFLIFPLVKGLHEFGHACAVKAWGGEVHEMGIMLLVLVPVPYVDASAASAFPQRSRRLLVGAAGMAVELFIAAVALFFWLEMEPGVLRAALFNVMVIASVSTVLFNANPLLRFDGYYMLMDLLDIPNLRQRGQQYLGSVVQQRLFGVNAPAPDSTASERAWFVFFTVGSFIYRIFIVLAIAVFVASEYMFLGVLLGVWAVVSALVIPLIVLVSYLATSPRLRRHRTRAALMSGAIALLVMGVVFLVPVPIWTNAQGVVWIPEQAVVRSGSEGFIVRLIARPGSRVRQGEPLLVAEDPVLPREIRVLEAKRDELRSRYQSEIKDQVVRAQMTLEELKALDADLSRARDRGHDLIVRSPVDGIFEVPVPQDLPGRFFRQGQQIGYVIPDSSITARVVVPQESVDLVRSRTREVLVKLAERIPETLHARMVREIPGASNRLPSMALSQAGGGEVALDPASTSEPTTLQSYFEFEIALPTARPSGLGGRIYVRFEHGTESIAWWLGRWVRQLFLQRFAV